jgi:hypothetical protein
VQRPGQRLPIIAGIPRARIHIAADPFDRLIPLQFGVGLRSRTELPGERRETKRTALPM